MIEPLRHRPAVMLECDHKARLHLHGRAELNGCPAWIRNVEGWSLMRHLDPLCRQTRFVEKALRFLEVLPIEHPHADALGLRLAARALEDEAVVAGLGNP